MSETGDTQPPAAAATAAPALDLPTALALLQHDTAPIAVCDAAGRVAWCNPALQRIAGHADMPWQGQALAGLLRLSGADTRLLQDALREGHAGALPDMRLGGAARQRLVARAAARVAGRPPRHPLAAGGRAATPCGRGAPPGRTAGHGTGLRPPGRVGARRAHAARALGPPRVRLLGPVRRRCHARLRHRDEVDRQRRPCGARPGLPRLDPARRHL